MNIVETSFEGLFEINPTVYSDTRGFFMESYNENQFKKNSLCHNFVQDNKSFSSKGVLRGLHFQLPPFEQVKLVECSYGKILDIAVDLRRSSNTFGQYKSTILSHENKLKLYIPAGFAHGFIVLSDFAYFSYKVSNFYNKDFDSGIFWNDQDLNIDWTLNKNEIIISNKDKSLSSFREFENPF